MEEENWDWEASFQNLRSKITDHPDFKGWHASLPTHTRQILDHILVNKVTREIILAADNSPEEEWNKYTFLRALGSGTTDPELANDMTEVALEIALWDIAKINGVPQQ